MTASQPLPRACTRKRLLAGFFLVSLPLLSQEFLFREFTPMDGLSHSTISSSFQDSEGYLWFGTYETVHRFDGVSFEAPLKALGIETHRIRKITQDRQGRIWIGSHQGAVCLDGEKARLLLPEDGLIHQGVNDITEDASGALWFATEAGISQWLPDGSWTHLTEQDGLPHPHVRRLLADKKGRMWIGTLGGLAFYEQGFLQPYPLETTEDTLAIFDMNLDSRGFLWLGTTSGLFCHTPEKDYIFSKDKGLPSESVWAIHVDSHGQVWAGTDAGLCVAPYRELLEERRFFRRVSRDHYIAFTTIYAIEEDREGSLWFGTCIGLFQLATPALKAYALDPSTSGEMALSLLMDGDDLWVGTDRGVARYRGDKLEPMPMDLNLPDPFVRCMAANPGGGVWFGTRKGLALRNLETPITLTAEDGLPSDSIFSLHQGPDGWLYIGTQDNGLAAWRPDALRVWNQADGLSGRRVHCLVPHPDGGLLIGTDRGLDWLYQGHIQSIPLPTTSSEVFAVAVDPEGTLWVGTHLGLVEISPLHTKRYQVADGLPDNQCLQVVLDRQSRPWIGTNKGLAVFDGVSFSSISPPPGALPIEVNHGSGFLDSQGSVWFGHYRGFVQILPHQFSPHRQPVPVVLTSATVFDQSFSTQHPLTLKAHQNQVRFNFHGLRFRDPQNLRFRYKLDGLDSQWIRSQLNHHTYSQLPPGHYLFQVQASTHPQNWSRQAARFSFTILPPFWQQTWFRVMILLLASTFIVWQFQQMRLRNRLLSQKADFLHGEVAKHQAAKLEREAEVKLLHSQMNPHFIQNAFTSAIHLVKANPSQAEALLHQLAQLFRRTMQAKGQVWSTLEEELALITDYLAIQKVRFGDRLWVETQVETQCLPAPVPAFILQPLVENACIHGQKENLGRLTIWISVQSVQSGIRVCIANSGRPFTSSDAPPIKPGHALDNIHKRLALLSQPPLHYRFHEGKHCFELHLEEPHADPVNR